MYVFVFFLPFSLAPLLPLVSQDATSILHGLALVKHHPGDRFLSRFLPSVLLPFRHAVGTCVKAAASRFLPPFLAIFLSPRIFAFSQSP